MFLIWTTSYHTEDLFQAKKKKQYSWGQFTPLLQTGKRRSFLFPKKDGKEKKDFF